MDDRISVTSSVTGEFSFLKRRWQGEKDLDDPGMHHIHEFWHGRMYWQYKQEEIEWQDKNYNKFLHHV